jgi:hypothetical protein
MTFCSVEAMCDDVIMSSAGFEPPERPARRVCCLATCSNPVEKGVFLVAEEPVFDAERRVVGRDADNMEPTFVVA